MDEICGRMARKISTCFLSLLSPCPSNSLKALHPHVLEQFYFGLDDSIQQDSSFFGSMQKIIEQYQKRSKDVSSNHKAVEQNMEHWKYEAAYMAKKIELLEVSKRQLLGEGLDTCSVEELQQIEQQLERSLSTIRGRKYQLFREQIETLQARERLLSEEQAMLSKKALQKSKTIQKEVTNNCSPRELDVETELFIGRPERGTTRATQLASAGLLQITSGPRD